MVWHGHEPPAFVDADVARQSIDAAPFDAIAYNGLQVNGAAEVDQSLFGNIFPGTGVETYFTDNWTTKVGGALSNMLVSTSSPGPPGFPSYQRIYTGTPVGGSLAAGDYAWLSTKIEGYRCARLAWGTASAQPVTIGFWVQGTLMAGTMTVAVRNAAANRSYLADVVINAAAAWEYKTITVPGDTTGTWETTNLTGMQIVFCGGGGSSVQGTASAWNASGSVATSGTGNFYSVADSQLFITVLIVVPGTEAPTAGRSPFIMRPQPQELALCQRYWQKTYTETVAPGTAAAFGGAVSGVSNGGLNRPLVYMRFPVIMRATPTIDFYSPNSGTAGQCFIVNAAADAAAVALDTASTGTSMYMSGSTTNDYQVVFHLQASARLP